MYLRYSALSAQRPCRVSTSPLGLKRSHLYHNNPDKESILMHTYRSILQARPRGNQHLRRDPPRAPRDDTQTLIKITKHQNKARREESLGRLKSALFCVMNARKLARSLKEYDAELMHELTTYGNGLTAKIEREDNRLRFRILDLQTQVSFA